MQRFLNTQSSSLVALPLLGCCLPGLSAICLLIVFGVAQGFCHLASFVVVLVGVGFPHFLQLLARGAGRVVLGELAACRSLRLGNGLLGGLRLGLGFSLGFSLGLGFCLHGLCAFFPVFQGLVELLFDVRVLVGLVLLLILALVVRHLLLQFLRLLNRLCFRRSFNRLKPSLCLRWGIILFPAWQHLQTFRPKLSRRGLAAAEQLHSFLVVVRAAHGRAHALAHVHHHAHHAHHRIAFHVALQAFQLLHAAGRACSFCARSLPLATNLGAACPQELQATNVGKLFQVTRLRLMLLVAVVIELLRQLARVLGILDDNRQLCWASLCRLKASLHLERNLVQLTFRRTSRQRACQECHRGTNCFFGHRSEPELLQPIHQQLFLRPPATRAVLEHRPIRPCQEHGDVHQGLGLQSHDGCSFMLLCFSEHGVDLVRDGLFHFRGQRQRLQVLFHLDGLRGGEGAQTFEFELNVLQELGLHGVLDRRSFFKQRAGVRNLLQHVLERPLGHVLESASKAEYFELDT